MTGHRAASGAREVWTIQALRFVAAFAVVLVHSTFYTHERLSPDFPLYDQGGQGVRLFFVISGFVMIMSSERLLGAARGWAAFAVKRVLRIVPLYWLVTSAKLAALLLTVGVVNHAAVDWPYIVASYLFVPMANADGEIRPLHAVGWTLNFEMFFYALFTVALLVRVRPVLFIAPVLVAMAAVSPLRDPAWPAAASFLCDPIVLDFLAGMLIARWVQRGGALPAAAAWAAVLVGLAGLFAPLDWPTMPALAQSLIITALCAAVIAGAASLESRIGARLPRWAVFLGAASYSLYLIHPLIAPAAPFALAKLHLAWPLAGVLGSLTIATAAGTACYLWVETPISRTFNRLAKKTRLLGPAPHIGGPRPEENSPAEVETLEPLAGAPQR